MRYKLHFSVNYLFHPLVVRVFIRCITDSVPIAFIFIQTLKIEVISGATSYTSALILYFIL